MRIKKTTGDITSAAAHREDFYKMFIGTANVLLFSELQKTWTSKFGILAHFSRFLYFNNTIGSGFTEKYTKYAEKFNGFAMNPFLERLEKNFIGDCQR